MELSSPYSIEIIVAYSLDMVIGVDGKIPWKLPTDMNNFRKVTIGHPVIMGHTTFMSLPKTYRPLPNRTNIILSHNSPRLGDTVFVSPSIEDALRFASEKTPDGKIFIAGGALVYTSAFPFTHKIHRTLVKTKIGRSDKCVIFPEDIMYPDEWDIESEKSYLHTDHLENEFSYTYTVAKRKVPPQPFC